MSKTSRIILLCVLIAVLAMCIVLYVAAKRPIEDTAYRNAGKTYASPSSPATRPMRGMIFAMRSQKQPWTRRTSRSPRRTLGRSRATITIPQARGRN